MTTSIKLFMIHMTSKLPQTSARHPQNDPDTQRHHPDTPQTQAFLRIRGHWEKRQYQSWHDFYTFLPTDLVLIHPQTPPDPSQTLPDTIQTPQDIDIFMQYRALEEKAISEYHGLIYLFANRFGIDASPDTLRHHLDIIQTPSDTIQTPPDIESTGRKGNIRVWPI